MGPITDTRPEAMRLARLARLARRRGQKYYAFFLVCAGNIAAISEAKGNTEDEKNKS